MRTLLIALAVVAPSAAGGCGRTALEPFAQSSFDAGAKDRPRDLPAEHMDAPPDMAMEKAVEHPPDLPPPPLDASPCVPKGLEICNSIDDDCDGLVDENQPPIPCPNGGNRLCVDGHYSDCPRRCVACVPGSRRTCITSFCTFWGAQECADDGQSFSKCVESQPPPECKRVAERMMRSPELEQCCIDNNYCCVDEFDLNHNGNRTEMLGRCEAVVCD